MATQPLSVFWSVLVFALAGLWVLIGIWTFVDNSWRRHHSGWAQGPRFLFIVFAPVIELLAFSIARPADRCPIVTDGWPTDETVVQQQIYPPEVRGSMWCRPHTRTWAGPMAHAPGLSTRCRRG